MRKGRRRITELRWGATYRRRTRPSELIPAPTDLPYPATTSSPRGSHPEVCRWWGWGRRLRVESRSTPGRLRGTALGTIRSLCEELAGPVAGITPSSHA
jgi:hypothetical protein